MTKRIQIMNFDTSEHKLVVKTQFRTASGEWVDGHQAGHQSLNHPFATVHMDVYYGRRIVVEEVEPVAPAPVQPVAPESLPRVTSYHHFTHWVRVHVFSNGVCHQFMDRAPGSFRVNRVQGDQLFLSLAPENHLPDGHTRAIKPINWMEFRTQAAKDGLINLYRAED